MIVVNTQFADIQSDLHKEVHALYANSSTDIRLYTLVPGKLVITIC